MKRLDKIVATPNLMLLDDVRQAIANVRDATQHECNQAILNRNFEDARWALAGKDACDRLEREIRFLAARRAETG